jgi:hypothetical protein
MPGFVGRGLFISTAGRPRIMLAVLPLRSEPIQEPVDTPRAQVEVRTSARSRRPRLEHQPPRL